MALSIRPVTRPVTRADKPRWAMLWQGYLAFYDTVLPPEVYDATFEAFFADDPHSPRCLVAEDNGHVLGLVHYVFHAHCWRPEGVCYLQDLFTDSTARGQGVGRALIEAVYHASDARGVSTVYWMTQDFNHTARKLYDSVGQVTPFVKYTRPA
ncbi:MAG: GNAT family N-acetyltransferase [Roseinatronobacter sp.]|nr:GNAT family N-acetyltransferase [Roseinatronobacter sp.]